MYNANIKVMGVDADKVPQNIPFHSTTSSIAPSIMQANPMLRSLSTDSPQKRDWKQRLSLRDNRRRDPVRVLHFDILD
ncbi:hypothetical protein MTP99_009486 [Tenebrio molitor]|nr:hypothetical protein MTP99_009486 [Tenebrio molitor]